ncbi:MAG: tetratricopeptide repeat protein [Byssovorax sp.]
MRLRRSLLRLSLLATLALSAGAASAAPSAKDKNDARALVTDAKKAIKEKRFADAEKALRSADELDPSPQNKIDLGQVLAEQGKLVDASKVLHSVADAADTSPAGKKAQDAAKKALKELEPKIPWIQVEVTGPGEGTKVVVKLDGAEVDATADIAADLGDHQVSVSADGFQPADKSLKLTEGAHEHLSFALAPAPSSKETKSGGTLVPGIIGLGVGAVGLGLGIGFGVMALGQTEDAKKNCTGNICSPAAADDISASKTSGNVSTAGFIIGGAGVAAGVVLLIALGGGKKDEKKDKPATSFSISPWAGLGSAGVHGTF